MKKTLAIAALAASLCIPSVMNAQGAPDDGTFQIAVLLQEDPILSGDAMPAPAGDEFADNQGIPGGHHKQAPDMQDGRRGPGPCPMMMDGRDGAKAFGQRGGLCERLDSKMALEDPAKFAELQKLREQEMQIVKGFAAKMKAEREEFKKLVDDYKANPSDDAKAKIRAKIAERHDAMLKAKETKLAELEKKLDAAKKGKDSTVNAMLERILSKPMGDRPAGCPGKGFKGGDRPGCCPGMMGPKGGDKPGCPMGDRPAPATEG